MNRKRLLYALAGLGGVAAWLLFILACSGWPAWSPDGGKLLFPYTDPASKESGIALYDRAGGSVHSVFRFHDSGSGNHLSPYAQFTRDGRRIVMAMEWDSERSPEVLVLPVSGGAPLQHFALTGSGEISLPPFPESGGNLFMGFNYIARLNLSTGAIETKPLAEGKGIYLMPDGDRIWYAVFEIERAGREGEGMQVGELNQADLSLKPGFEFWKSDEEKNGITSFNSFSPVPEPGGSRLLISAQVKDQPALLLFGKSGLEQIIRPVFPVEGCQIFGVAWSADRKSAYAATLVPVKEPDTEKANDKGKGKNRQDLALAEIPLGGGAVRLTTVAHLFKLPPPDDGLGIYLHASLSPDGHMLATTTGYLPNQYLVSPRDRGLFLIDLKDPARQVNRVGIPAPVKAGQE